MTFSSYLKVKGWFLTFFALVMILVSLVMYTSLDHGQNAGNIVYVNAVCFFGAILYIVIGYYYRRVFYLKLGKLAASGVEELAAALPEPQHAAQAYVLELVRNMHRVHADQLQLLLRDKREHQDYIMSWIHEVKLPITASRLLMENNEGRTVEEFVDKLEDELDKIDNYIEQALYYSRIDSFYRDYFITEVPLQDVIKSSLKKYAKMFITKGIRVHLDEEHTFAQSDSKWLAYIIDQIVANSLKYTSEDGAISFRFEEDSREKRLLISDTGIGIKPEDLSRVFDKGFTGWAGRTHSKSTGMGLYLANQLALKLGHTLSIQSEEGSFTTVTVHFLKFSER